MEQQVARREQDERRHVHRELTDLGLHHLALDADPVAAVDLVAEAGERVGSELALADEELQLAGTVSNLCLRMLDRLRRMRSSDDDAIFESIEASDDATDARLIVNEAMSRLDTRSRELCRHIAIEGSSYADVSASMSLPVGSIGPLYIRAKQRLRRTLES